MGVEEFKAALQELKIAMPEELVVVVFKHIDSNHDGSITIEELMACMRNQRWWRTSSPLGTPRSRSTSPIIPTWSAVDAGDRASMYATSMISQLPDQNDREHAIEEAAQRVWQEARERLERSASSTEAGESSSAPAETTSRTMQTKATAQMRPNPVFSELTAREEKALRAEQAYGNTHLGWGRASP